MVAKANDGAPGVDGESSGDIETKGVMKWLEGLGNELHDKTYQPQPVRRVRRQYEAVSKYFDRSASTISVYPAYNSLSTSCIASPSQR